MADKIGRNQRPVLKYKFIAIDQHGTIVWIRKHPRKELMEHCGTKRVSRMFMTIGTRNWHIGYVVGNLWFDVHGLEGNVFIKEVS